MASLASVIILFKMPLAVISFFAPPSFIDIAYMQCLLMLSIENKPLLSFVAVYFLDIPVLFL